MLAVCSCDSAHHEFCVLKYTVKATPCPMHSSAARIQVSHSPALGAPTHSCRSGWTRSLQVQDRKQWDQSGAQGSPCRCMPGALAVQKLPGTLQQQCCVRTHRHRLQRRGWRSPQACPPARCPCCLFRTPLELARELWETACKLQMQDASGIPAERGVGRFSKRAASATSYGYTLNPDPDGTAHPDPDGTAQAAKKASATPMSGSPKGLGANGRSLEFEQQLS